MKKPKICYIMPEHKINTYRHYQHLYDYFESLAKKVDLYILIETGEPFPTKPANYDYYLVKHSNPLLARIEILLILLFLRIKGYKIFYSHYSYRGALIASFITNPLFGRTYLWHCMMVKKMQEEGKVSIKIQKNLFNTLNRVQHLVTGSNFMAKEYSKYGKFTIEKVVVVPNWIDLKRFNPKKYNKQEIRKELGIPLGKKVILFVHSFGAGKGPGFLPGIFYRMTQARDDLYFIVVGGVWPKEKEHKEQAEIFKEGIDQYKLWDILSWKGHIPNSEIHKYYLAADLFIMPSKFEGFSRVLLESMAMGTPFVSTTGGGGVLEYTSQLQQEFIIPPKDIEKRFHVLCLNLLHDETKLKSLSEHGLKWVKRYDIESILPIFIERVINGKHSYQNPLLSSE